jgi:alpha-tubulin suppressor-like RCC1 family protein
LGTGSPIFAGNVVQVKNLNNVSMLSSNGYYTYSLAMKQDGSVWAWGENSLYGNLGDSSNTNRFEPVKINGVSDVKKVLATQGYASYALHHNGTVSAWGNNVSGRLGNAEPMSSRNYPAQVSVISNVVDIAAGGAHAIALTSDGKLWSWGNNSKGQLGDGTMIHKNTPVQVQGICEIDVEVSVPEVSVKPVQYTIYPNPATHTLHIDFTNTIPNKIELLDLQGRTLYTQSVSSSQTTHEISLAGFSTGVYFVKLHSDEGVVLRKIVKE